MHAAMARSAQVTGEEEKEAIGAAAVMPVHVHAQVVRKLLHDSREKPHIFMKQLSKFLDKVRANLLHVRKARMYAGRMGRMARVMVRWMGRSCS